MVHMQIEGNRQICLIPLIDSSINYKYLHKNRLPNKVSNFYHYVGKKRLSLSSKGWLRFTRLLLEMQGSFLWGKCEFERFLWRFTNPMVLNSLRAFICLAIHNTVNCLYLWALQVIDVVFLLLLGFRCRELLWKQTVEKYNQCFQRICKLCCHGFYSSIYCQSSL